MLIELNWAWTLWLPAGSALRAESTAARIPTVPAVTATGEATAAPSTRTVTSPSTGANDAEELTATAAATGCKEPPAPDTLNVVVVVVGILQRKATPAAADDTVLLSGVVECATAPAGTGHADLP